MKRMALWVVVAAVVLAGLGIVAAPVNAQGFGGDEIVMGEDWVLRSGEDLEGNLVVLGGTATIQPGAVVRGDVNAAGGLVTIDGTVTGNVGAFGGAIRLGDTAVIEGDVANFAGSLSRAPGATVNGDVFSGLRTPQSLAPEQFDRESFDDNFNPPGDSWFVSFLKWQLGTAGSILLMLLLGLVLIVVAPRAVERVADAAALQPALTFGVGFLTLVLGVLAGALLLIACGLGLLVWLLLMAAALLGWTGVALWLGRQLFRAFHVRSSASIVQMIVGIILITLMSRLPWCLGWLSGLIFASWGLGAVVTTRFGTQAVSGAEPSRPPYRPIELEDLPELLPPAWDDLAPEDDASIAGDAPDDVPPLDPEPEGSDEGGDDEGGDDQPGDGEGGDDPPAD